jgi:hypothetical protein
MNFLQNFILVCKKPILKILIFTLLNKESDTYDIIIRGGERDSMLHLIKSYNLYIV